MMKMFLSRTIQTVLVKLSEQGYSGAVRALIEDCPPQQKSSLVNAGDKWTGDTPLSAAAKQGHLNIVGTLLLQGADPTVETSTLRGREETAKAGVKTQIQNLETMLENIDSGDHYIFDKDAWLDSEDFIIGSLEKLRMMRKCLNLI